MTMTRILRLIAAALALGGSGMGLVALKKTTQRERRPWLLASSVLFLVSAVLTFATLFIS